jgi:uncharacterized membrane protein
MGNLRHSLFIISILLKGVFAVLEVIAGLVLLISLPGQFTQFVHFMFHNRLVADPNDPFALYILHQLQDFDMRRHTFVGVYLMLHGLVKVGVVAILYSERLWAFPIGLTVLGIFIAYEFERFVATHSLVLLALSLLDAFIMILAWREYLALKNRRA